VIIYLNHFKSSTLVNFFTVIIYKCKNVNNIVNRSQYKNHLNYGHSRKSNLVSALDYIDKTVIYDCKNAYNIVHKSLYYNPFTVSHRMTTDFDHSKVSILVNFTALSTRANNTINILIVRVFILLYSTLTYLYSALANFDTAVIYKCKND
jgi:hypothetical protein